MEEPRFVLCILTVLGVLPFFRFFYSFFIEEQSHIARDNHELVVYCIDCSDIPVHIQPIPLQPAFTVRPPDLSSPTLTFPSAFIAEPIYHFHPSQALSPGPLTACRPFAMPITPGQ